MTLLASNEERATEVGTAHKDDDDSFGFDWVNELKEGEYIYSSVWNAPSGVSIQNAGFSGTVTKVWLDDPASKDGVELTNTIETTEMMPDGGRRKLNRSLNIKIRPL